MTDVYGEDLIATFETQLGHALSGDYDMRNGYDHPWAYYCEAGVESTGRNCGLDVPARGSATGAGLIAAVEGMLTRDEPEHGDVIVFGPSFYWPYGHTGFWNAQRGQLLGTLTDGTGVGYKNWGPWTSGYMGRYRLDGVVGPRRDQVPDPPPVNWYVQPDNPYSPDDAGADIGIGGGFLRMYQSIALGQDPMTVLGYATANESDAFVIDDDGMSRARTIQRFERGVLIYQEGEPFPWDVVMALASQTITTP